MVEARLSPGPGDGDLSVGLGGDGGEGTDREVERVVRDTGGADIGDLSSDRLSVVGVDNVDPLATEVRGSTRVVVLPPSVGVDSNDLVRVGVDDTTGTGVSTLVEVGSVTTGHDLTGGTGRSLGGLSRSLVGGGRGRSLGGGGSLSDLDLGIGDGRRGGGRVLSSGGDVGRGSVGTGRDGGSGSQSRGRGKVGSVGSAV